MTVFAGYHLPLHYTGILDEHAAARKGAALFDTAHMGQLLVSGAGAVDTLERLLTCRVSTIALDQCRYGLMLDVDGGVRDDLILYRLAVECFLLVTNAATRASDLSWIKAHLLEDTRVEDRTERFAKLDLQGPGAPRIAELLLDSSLHDLRYFHFGMNSFKGSEVLISRTGYTGEVGFELYLEPETARRFWRAALTLGARPAGLGARDTLRLEVGLPLYGHELCRERNASSSGVARSMDFGKEFIGAAAVRAAGKGAWRSVGLLLKGRRAARAGDEVMNDGVVVGKVTSGSFAPSLGCAVALAVLAPEVSQPGTRLAVGARASLEAEVVLPPFYRQGSARKPLAAFLETIIVNPEPEGVAHDPQ